MISNISNISNFWTDNVENSPDAKKYKAIGQFEPKVLVWCAFSTFIGTVKSQTVDADDDHQMSAQTQNVGEIHQEAQQK
jgi:hypothetical protein